MLIKETHSLPPTMKPLQAEPELMVSALAAVSLAVAAATMVEIALTKP